jgi:hypothetical protein
MNGKANEWEHYTDDTGRRHWRWPASDVRDVRLKVQGQFRNVALPEPSRGREIPTRDRGE